MFFLGSAERFMLSIGHLLLTLCFPLCVPETQRTGAHVKQLRGQACLCLARAGASGIHDWETLR